MLTINLDQIANVIVMARDFDRSDAELHALIQRLDPDEQSELTAVFWIGRGSFDAEDLADAIATAREEATIPTDMYLTGSPHLADHLEAGLEALGINPEDLEDSAL